VFVMILLMVRSFSISIYHDWAQSRSTRGIAHLGLVELDGEGAGLALGRHGGRHHHHRLTQQQAHESGS
jgi:hypothetical protein